ncbi:MAG: GDSL-type esterase/lipase family protein [Balneolaceae bacterium]
MRSIIITILTSLLLLFAQCNSPVSEDSNSLGPQAPAPSSITQTADSISGVQAESTEFRFSDYFTSESNITVAQFASDSIAIEELGNETYLLSQPDSLFGGYIISGLLVNESSDTLEAELIYNIVASAETDSDTTSGTDPGDDNSGEDDTGTDTGDDDSGDDNSGNDDSGEDDSEDEDSGDDSENDNEDDESDSPATESELIIMPLGDSITNDGRSRIKLWHLLVDDGYSINYVGDQVQRNSLPDHDHEGVGGITIQEVADKTESLMRRHKPQYVFLMIGTNDMAWYFDETGEEIAERWDDLVQLIFDSSDPDMYIIAATIPPVTSKENGKETMPDRDRAVIVKDYNTAMRVHIENRIAAGDNIVLADVEDALNLNEHVASDGVHLNEAGYHVMGAIYYEAIISILE